MTQKKINLLGIRNRVILAHFDGPRGGFVAVMEAIDENEETLIDNSKNRFNHKQHEFKDGRIIDGDHIYMYGKIDLNNKEDVSLILDKNLIGEQDFIRSDFNYEEGVHYVYDKVMDSPCSNPIEWFKYNYCLLGKPERIIVYKTHLSYIK